MEIHINFGKGFHKQIALKESKKEIYSWVNSKTPVDQRRPYIGGHLCWKGVEYLAVRSLEEDRQVAYNNKHHAGRHKEREFDGQQITEHTKMMRRN